MCLSQIRLSAPPSLLVLMLKIRVASYGNSASIFFVLQLHVLSWNKSLTSACFVDSVAGPIGCSIWVVDNHGSYPTLTAYPFPIAQPRCFMTRSRPMRTLLHPWEQFDAACTSYIELYLQYFHVRILASNPSGLDIRRQLSFLSRALLKHCMYRKPNPPSLFVFVIVPQEIQDIFRWSWFESHQKRVRADCICLFLN